MQRYTPDQLANMDPDDFQQYAERAKKDAVRQPTEENGMHYYEVQEVARTNAVVFANASQLIWQKYPNLSVAKDYSIATPGRNALTRQQSGEWEWFLAKTRAEFCAPLLPLEHLRVLLGTGRHPGLLYGALWVAGQIDRNR